MALFAVIVRESRSSRQAATEEHDTSGFTKQNTDLGYEK